VSFAPGPVSISAVAINAESLVSPAELIAGAAVITTFSLNSAESFGDISLFNVQQIIRFDGLPTEESFGATSLLGGADLAGWLVATIKTREALYGAINAWPALHGSVEVNRVH
jgi:hypothetical protein